MNGGDPPEGLIRTITQSDSNFREMSPAAQEMAEGKQAGGGANKELILTIQARRWDLVVWGMEKRKQNNILKT